jgi:sulfur carrier protein ThiS
VSLSSAPATAQTTRGPLTAVEQARWRALLQQAFAQSNEGQHAVALQLAEEASSTLMTPGVRLFLAEEHEFLSRAPEGVAHLADAERLASLCFNEATDQRSLDGRDRILRDCAAVRNRTQARMARLSVNVPTPPPGVAVQVNGETLPAVAYGTEALRLPGTYVVEATAPQHGTFRHTAILGEGASASVTVTLPARGEVRTTREQPTAPTRTPDVLPPVFTPLPEAPDTTGTVARVAGVSLLGLGVVAGGIGIWQAIVTSNQVSDARSGTGEEGAAWARYDNAVAFPTSGGARTLTVEQVCERAAADASRDPDAATAQNLCDSNSTSRALALGFGIGGGVLAAAGAVLLIVARPTASPEAQRVTVAPVFLRGGGGAVVGVRF